MKTVAVEDTTLTTEDLARLAEKEPVILTRKGDQPGGDPHRAWIETDAQSTGQASGSKKDMISDAALGQLRFNCRCCRRNPRCQAGVFVQSRSEV